MIEQSTVLVSKAAVSLGRLFCSHLRSILLLCFALLILTAFGAPLFESSPLSSISKAIYGMDSHLCHQIPGRCLHISGLPFAVCARCFGGYVGILFAGLIFTRKLALSDTLRRLITLFGIIGLLDAAFQIAQLYSTGNIMRLASGTALGFACGMFAFRFISSIELHIDAEFPSAA